jgi:hypothetical protein
VTGPRFLGAAAAVCRSHPRQRWPAQAISYRGEKEAALGSV